MQTVLWVGRGAYGKPWLISQIDHYLKTGEEKSAPSIAEQLDIVTEHYEVILDYYGESVGAYLLHVSILAGI